MAGLGLMNRRRAIQSSPTISEIDTSGYVQDSILMWLDGIEKGGEAGVWKDKKGVNNFVSVGAVELENGWEFDGASHMECDGGTNYTVTTGKTLEVCVEFYGNNDSEVVLITNSGGYAFYRKSTGYIFMTAGSDFPTGSNPDKLAAAKVCYAKRGTGNYYNGVSVGSPGNGRVYTGNAVFYLGMTASGSYPFKGKIHAIRLHNRLLTTEEILQNQQLDNIRFKLGIEALNPTE